MTYTEPGGRIAPTAERVDDGELHGGNVEARSWGSGQTSEFIVRLPPLAAAPTTARAHLHRKEFAAASLRILVVEDDEDSAASLKMLLELRGHHVEVTRDGPSALDVARRHAPDAVLLDIALPAMDGFEIVRRLRLEPRLYGTTFIAVSGYDRTQDQQRASDAGFAHYLVKPVKPEVLLRLLDRCERRGVRHPS